MSREVCDPITLTWAPLLARPPARTSPGHSRTLPAQTPRETATKRSSVRRAPGAPPNPDPGGVPCPAPRRSAWGTAKGQPRRGGGAGRALPDSHCPRAARATQGPRHRARPSGRKLALAPPLSSYRSWRLPRLQPPQRRRRWRRPRPHLPGPPRRRCPPRPVTPPRSPLLPLPRPLRPPRLSHPPPPRPRLHFPARPRCCWRACFCGRLYCSWGWASPRPARGDPGARRPRRLLPAAPGRLWRALGRPLSSGARPAVRPEPRHPGRRALSGFLEPARAATRGHPRLAAARAQRARERSKTLGSLREKAGLGLVLIRLR